MKRLLWLPLALALGCATENELPEESSEFPMSVLLPPKRIMERPPSFRFKDLQEEKEYFLRFYEDGPIRLEIVTVRDGRLGERGATPEENRYALSVFVKDWKQRGDTEHLQFHNDLYENERWRDATLLELEIRAANVGLEGLIEHRNTALFNLRARRDTGVTPETGHHEPGSGFLQKRVVELDRQIRLTEARIDVLRYAQKIRDWNVSRSTQENWVRKTFSVKQILRHWSSDDLIGRIRAEVAFESWANPRATLRISGNHLVVTQKAWVIRELDSHLPNLRAQAVAIR